MPEPQAIGFVCGHPAGGSGALGAEKGPNVGVPPSNRPPLPPPSLNHPLSKEVRGRVDTQPHQGTGASYLSYATIHDCPQEVLDHIFASHSPISQPISKMTMESMNDLTDLMSWLLKLAVLNRRWCYAITPLLRSITRLSTNLKYLPGQVSFAKRNSSTIRRVVLDCRYPWGNSDADRNNILSRFQECLSACTQVRILDVIYLNHLLWDNLPDTKQITSRLFSHISSNNLHSLAIVSTNLMTLHILDSFQPEVGIRDLEIQMYSGQRSSKTLQTSYPSIKRLTLTHVTPRSFPELCDILFVATQPTSDRRSSSISELSFTSTCVGISLLERLLNMNRIGESLLYLHFDVRWVDPRGDFASTPGTILGLCPRLEIFYFFAPCPTSIFTSIPTTLLELGILVIKDAKAPAISDVETIIEWSNDPSRRKNVRKLVVQWYLDDQRKRRDQRMLRKSILGVELYFVDP
ncbi:hypothetical protein BDN72DRAFT_835917, partial [Pluteus cervinus]